MIYRSGGVGSFKTHKLITKKENFHCFQTSKKLLTYPNVILCIIFMTYNKSTIVRKQQRGGNERPNKLKKKTNSKKRVKVEEEVLNM